MSHHEARGRVVSRAMMCGRGAAPRAAALLLTFLAISLVACGSSTTVTTAPESTGLPAATTATAGATTLDSCVPASAAARAVEFSAAGETITGAEFGSRGTVGIVLAHEYMSNLCGWIGYAQHVRDLGYRALAFDFRSHLVADVTAAADQLRRDGATTIVLMGASMGGTASLSAAAAAPASVAAVAALSAPSEFMGLDGLAASRALAAPVLYMAAQDNGEFPGDARAMYAVCPSAHRQLDVLQGSDHGTALLRGSVASQAQSLLDAFVAASTS